MKIAAEAPSEQTKAGQERRVEDRGGDHEPQTDPGQTAGNHDQTVEEIGQTELFGVGGNHVVTLSRPVANPFLGARRRPMGGTWVAMSCS